MRGPTRFVSAVRTELSEPVAKWLVDLQNELLFVFVFGPFFGYMGRKRVRIDNIDIGCV